MHGGRQTTLSADRGLSAPTASVLSVSWSDHPAELFRRFDQLGTSPLEYTQ